MSEQQTRTSREERDRQALAEQGKQVRERLKANPQVYDFKNPRAEIFAVGDFMSEEECNRMVALIDRVAKPSATFDTPYEAAYRTSYSGDVNPMDPFVRKINRRIDDLLGIRSEFGEALQGQRYLPGQEFQAHCDWFYTEAEYWQREKDRGGQRSWTAMTFLNDVEEGGNTDFPHLGLSFEPKKGALLIWNNMNLVGEPNTWTTHAGTPVKAGVKYVTTKWYRTREWC